MWNLRNMQMNIPKQGKWWNLSHHPNLKKITPFHKLWHFHGGIWAGTLVPLYGPFTAQALLYGLEAKWKQWNILCGSGKEGSSGVRCFIQTLKPLEVRRLKYVFFPFAVSTELTIPWGPYSSVQSALILPHPLLLSEAGIQFGSWVHSQKAAAPSGPDLGQENTALLEWSMRRKLSWVICLVTRKWSSVANVQSEAE